MFEIGKIVNTQGLKGELRVLPTTDDPKRFELLNEIDVYFLDGKKESFTLEKIRYHKQFVIIKLKELDDINQVLFLKGASIKIPRELAMPLNEGEYYICDLYNIQVVEESGEDLGFIKDILFTGANDVYVVAKENEKDLLIPAIKQCILSVDIDNKIMTVKLLKGLR